MSDLPEIYDRFELEEQLRDLQQKIDDLKTQVYFTPQSSAPVDVEVGTLAYSDGTNTDNTFGNSAEGFYYYASGTTWTQIGGGNGLVLGDDKRIKLGDGTDFEIYHDGTTNKSIIKESNASASLQIQGENIFITNTAASKSFIQTFDNEDVALYSDGNIKLKTVTGGVDVTGRIKITPQSSAPSSPTAGMIYYDSDDNKLKLHNGTSFVDLN
tara:strand:+ start:262 stop:897 length:636 start_codon:yes stop_codon:yes gene_type:complete